MTNAFILLEKNTLARGEKCVFRYAFFLLYYSDERFRTGDKRVECAFQLPPHTATHVATINFQAGFLSKLLFTGTHLRKRAVATLSYSPAKYATPTSYIRNRVLCWTKPPSSRVQYPRCAVTICATPTQLLREGQQEAYAREGEAT